VSILGRVLFNSKSEPAVDWSEIESRLQEISTPAGSSDHSVEPSAGLAHDPALADEPPVSSEPPIAGPLSTTSDSPVMNSGDPLDDMLSQLAAVSSNRS
jgi:hypothetical protein